jgi:hypothetical protein
MKFMIGCDPEVFLKSKKYGHYTSAVGLIGGSKHKPLAIDKDGHFILEDNVAVEFNTKPAEDVQSFRSSIHKVLDHLRGILPEYELDKASAVSFPEAELQTPEAQEFGCEPDYNAWTKSKNPKPQAADENLRSCGGHIHVGSDIAINSPIDVIRACDLFLGVPSVAMDHGTLRRKLYGKAGSFRIKPYGVEYRTLSNFWIFDDTFIDWAYQGTQAALNFVANGGKIPEADGFLIQRCINTSNVEDARHIQNLYGI